MCYRNNPTKPELEIRKLSEVELQEVQWLWYPYIPFQLYGTRRAVPP